MAAAKAGHPEILKDLLAAHAQVDARDPLGTSALMLIAHTDDTTSLRRLLDAGAPLESVDKAGRTALWHAARSGRSKRCGCSCSAAPTSITPTTPA